MTAAEKKLTEAIGIELISQRSNGIWRKLWSHALSVMEENERLKRELRTIARSLGQPGSDEVEMPVVIGYIHNAIHAKNLDIEMYREREAEAKLAGEKPRNYKKLAAELVDLINDCDDDSEAKSQANLWLRSKFPLPPTEGKASQEQNGEREK